MKCRWLMATARNDKTMKSACLGNAKMYRIEISEHKRFDPQIKVVFLCRSHSQGLMQKISDLFVKEDKE